MSTNKAILKDLQQEYMILKQKIIKLDLFTETIKFAELPDDLRPFFWRQKEGMEIYAEALKNRIIFLQNLEDKKEKANELKS